MLDLLQLKTFTAFVFITGLVILFIFEVFLTRQVLNKHNKSINNRSLLGLMHIVGVFILWMLVSLFNYFTSQSKYSLLGTRLAFGVVPFSFMGAFLILLGLKGLEEKIINTIKNIKRGVIFLIIILFVVSLFDINIVENSIAHYSIGKRDVPVLGHHALFYSFGVLLLLIITLYTVFYVYKTSKSAVIRARLKVVGLITLFATSLIMVFNMIIPIVFHITSLIDYGILSSLLVVFGFYIALEDNWVYSIKYLISKHTFIWIAGVILFVSVKFFEILMSQVFGWNITNFSDINANLFGILLGIIVAYVSLALIKYSETIGLILIYPSFFRFKKKFNNIISRSVDEKMIPSDILKELLTIIVKFLKIENACFTDLDSMLTRVYKICVNNKQDLTLNYVRIPILKKRFLVLIGKNFWVPKEFIEFFLTKTLTINSLINLDITSTTLKSINKQLAKAVVTRTSKLEQKLVKTSENLKHVQIEFDDCKRMFPNIFSNVLFNVKTSFDYLEIIGKKLPDDYELRFNLTRLQEQLIKIKGVLHRVVIFSDVVMNKRVYRQRLDIKAHLLKLLDAWQVQFDNKAIGVVRDLAPNKVFLRYDYDKVDFIFNTIIGYMLINLRHGYLHAIQRNDLGKVLFNFKAIGQPKETGYTPVLDDKLVNSMILSLTLMERIVKLHNGVFSYVFQNSILYDVTFSLSKL